MSVRGGTSIPGHIDCARQTQASVFDRVLPWFPPSFAPPHSPPPLEVNLKAIDIPPPPLGAPLPPLSYIINHLVPSLPLLLPLEKQSLITASHNPPLHHAQYQCYQAFYWLLLWKIAILFIYRVIKFSVRILFQLSVLNLPLSVNDFPPKSDQIPL